MRLLIVTWLYEPNSTPRATRWKTVAREMVNMGCQVDVITSRAQGQPRFEIVAGVRVHRCGGSAGSSLASFAKGDRAHAPLAAMLRELHKSTWKQLYWPDKACLWLLPALRTAERLLAETPYDGLLTVSLPFTAHLAGFLLKRKHPELPWLADVGDPFSCQHESAPNNTRLHKERNRIWEARIFQTADRVAVTNPAMMHLYKKLFPASAEKFLVIPPVLGSDVPAASPRGLKGKTSLLFLGTLYGKIRNPAYLLAVFEQLHKASPNAYELHFAGDLNDCEQMVGQFAPRLGSALIAHGKQPRAEAMRLLSEADFVVNIGNTTPFQLPSKLVEYAAMGKHIINISPGEQDSSADFLKDYPGAFHMLQTEVPTAAAVSGLERFLTDPPPVRLDRLEPWLHRFSPRRIASDYLDTLPRRAPERKAA